MAKISFQKNQWFFVTKPPSKFQIKSLHCMRATLQAVSLLLENLRERTQDIRGASRTRRPRYSRLCRSRGRLAPRISCSLSFFAFFPTDSRAKETLLAVYMRAHTIPNKRERVSHSIHVKMRSNDGF